MADDVVTRAKALVDDPLAWRNDPYQLVIADLLAEHERLRAELQEQKEHSALMAHGLDNRNRSLEAAEAEVARLRAFCGEMYQAAGAYDMPTRVLDNLIAATTGEPLPHDSILPMEALLASLPPSVPAQTEEIVRLQQEKDELLEKVNELIECSSIFCPYEKRMREVEAERGHLQTALREMADEMRASRTLARTGGVNVDEWADRLSALLPGRASIKTEGERG